LHLPQTLNEQLVLFRLKTEIRGGKTRDMGWSFWACFFVAGKKDCRVLYVGFFDLGKIAEFLSGVFCCRKDCRVFEWDFLLQKRLQGFVDGIFDDR
jgi:hypothetical protein